MITIQDIRGFFFHNYYKGLELDSAKVIKYIEQEGVKDFKISNMGGFIYEQIEILKLQTIKKFLGLSGSSAKVYYNKITSDKTKKDKLNLIKNKGVYLTEEEFNHYLELYKQIQSEWKKLS